MITKIVLEGKTPFSKETPSIDDLRQINFFWGANASGKTTISRVIANSTSSFESVVEWANGIALETRVYNRDFVDKNFKQVIPGVFTLGEQGIEIQARIEVVTEAIKKLDQEIRKYIETLNGENGSGGKTIELIQLENLYEEKFWNAKLKYQDKFSDAFSRSIGSKKIFKKKILDEFMSNSADLLPVVDLEILAATVYSKNLRQVENIETIQSSALLALEKMPILSKRIIGKEDVDIAAIIKRLGNSDWVRDGLTYFEANNGICPFCQQATPKNLAANLSEYFDETFENDTAAIIALESDYSRECIRIQSQVQAIIDLNSEFVDGIKLEREKTRLDAIIVLNLQRISQKKKEANRVVELDSLQVVLEALMAEIKSANDKIIANNAIVRNIANERPKLTSRVWKFIVEELKDEILDYRKQKSDLAKAIETLEAKIATKNKEKTEQDCLLHDLEKCITSIQPTCDNINSLLASFGFTRFRLEIGGDGKSYHMVRPDGSDAHATLSEGEKNFITFLYFYHMLRGSTNESGTIADKIVVFDDPVSSLDSDVLYIVSTLIRQLFENIRANRGTIKQVFIFTHNFYFHKEVSFNPRRATSKSGLLNEESFWMIKKRDADSVIERQSQNPIKTSYEMLWEEVRATPENRNKATIQNTLRRILESYFKLLGGITLDEICEQFGGDDKIKCRDLCSWINDGSHGNDVLTDVYYPTPDDATIQMYLNIFEEIFKKTKHDAHYKMMMGSPVS